VVSPDGTQNADTATETSATSQHGLSSGLISFASGTTYTFSTFAKNAPSGRGFIQLYGYQLGAAAANVFANFDINTGVVGTLSGGTSTITNYGNGWYRCTFTFACGNSLSERINLFNVSSASATSGQSYVGDITKAIYWYGAQAEASSYPTSYINTTSATATRVADACFKTGISSLIGQTEGVLFVDINYLSHEAQSIFVIEDWVANSTVIRILSDTSTSLGAQVYVAASGGNQYTSTFNSAVVGQRYKCALAYKANDFAFYVNGTQVSTSSSGLVPTTSNVRFGAFISGQVMDGQINQAILFPTRLSNSELASLTTI